jgi:hypothetical protein
MIYEFSIYRCVPVPSEKRWSGFLADPECAVVAKTEKDGQLIENITASCWRQPCREVRLWMRS